MEKYSYDLREEKLFLIMYSLWLLDALIGISMWRYLPLINITGDYIKRAAYCLLIVQFFLKKRYTRRDVAGIFLIVLTGILAYHSVYNRHIMSGMILIYFSANVDYRKTLKCTFLVQGSFMLVTILASQLDVIEDVIWQQENERLRQSLGYDYCGYPAHLMLFMTLTWFSIRKKARPFEVALFFALNTAIYLVTDSRADYYLSLIAMLGFCFVCRMENHKTHPIFEIIIKYGCGILAVFSIVCHFFFDANNETMLSINAALNNRLQLGKQAIEEYGFSLFGQSIRWYGQGSLKNHPDLIYNYVDCAFLKELLSFGIVFLIVLVVAYYFVGKYLAEEKNYVLGWAMVVSFMYAVVNAHLCMAQYNVFILLLGTLLKSGQYSLPEKTNAKNQGFLCVMRDWADQIFTENGKHVLRILLLLVLLIIPAYVQRLGTGQMVSSASLYRWVSCGMLFLLAGLIYEGRYSDNKKMILFYGVVVFLILAMVSDYFVDKKFRYAAFAVFAFGGMFVFAWRSRKYPEILMEEFKTAYKVYFVLVILGGIIRSHSILGFCNQGMFLSEAENAIIMLIAIVIFLDDIKKSWTTVYHMAAVLVSLYVLYTTGQKILLLTGIGIIIIYLAVICYKRYGHKSKRSAALLTALIVSGCAILGFFFLWKLHPNDYFGILRTYLKQTNLFGHSYVPKFQNARAWVPSSIVMNVYRYGVLAGGAYFLAGVSYFVMSCRQMLRTKSFLPIGLAIAIFVINESVAVGFPFTHVAWILTGISVGYALTVCEGEISQKKPT